MKMCKRVGVLLSQFLSTVRSYKEKVSTSVPACTFFHALKRGSKGCLPTTSTVSTSGDESQIIRKGMTGRRERIVETKGDTLEPTLKRHGDDGTEPNKAPNYIFLTNLVTDVYSRVTQLSVGVVGMVVVIVLVPF